MHLHRSLASVSAVALLTAAGATGARADTLLFDLTAVTPTLTLAVGSSSISDTSVQLNKMVLLSATLPGGFIGIPGALGVTDVDNGVDTFIVDFNTIFTKAIGNTDISSVDAHDATGTATTSAASLGLLQENTAAGGTSTITSSISGSGIQIAVDGPGSGTNLKLVDNEMTADGFGNIGVASITGNLNIGLASAELGHSVIDDVGAPYEIVTGATFGLASHQANLQIQPSATVDGSRIGAVATTTTPPPDSIDGATLDISRNLIRAEFVGNDLTQTLSLDDNKTPTFNGSAGITSSQFNAGFDAVNTGTDVYKAVITDSAIEAGDSGAGTAFADLDTTTLTFSNNDILAQGISNRTSNSLSLNGLSLNGTATTGDVTNTISNVDSKSSVGADLFIHNVQNSSVDVTASNAGNLNVLVEDSTGPSITVGDSDLSDTMDYGNSIGASAIGSMVANSIAIDGGATVDGFAAINSAQQTSYFTLTTSSAFNAATTTGVLNVEVADQAGADGTVTGTKLFVSGNDIYAEGIANSQSSAITVAAGTVDFGGAGVEGVIGAPSIDNDWAGGTGSIAADFTVGSGQLLSGGNSKAAASAQASVSTAILVTAGAPKVGSALTGSDITVDGNTVSALAIGNLSSENSIAIDATTFRGTAAVGSAQLVHDQAVLSSEITQPLGSVIYVEAAPTTISDVKIAVDNNQILSRTWGNLVDDSTNSLSVTAQTVADDDVGTQATPFAGVTRDGQGVSHSVVQGGLAVLNEQMVEDLEGQVVTASIGTGNTIELDLGISIGTKLSDTKASVSGNTLTSQAILNDATSQLLADAGTLTSAAVLANVQSVLDQDGVGVSAAVKVDMTDPTVLVAVASTGTTDNLGVTVDSNTLTATGQMNLATNTVDVSATTFNVTPQYTGAVDSVVLGDTGVGTGTVARGDVVLANDQRFAALGDAGAGAGLEVGLTGALVDVSFNGLGTLTKSTIELSGNKITSQALGNEAHNDLSITSQTYDLSAAGSGGPANGPVAGLASNQTAGTSAFGLTSTISAAQVIAAPPAVISGSTTVRAGDTDLTDGIDTGNQIRAQANVNTVENTVSFGGGSFVTPTTSAPAGRLIDTASGDDIVLSDVAVGLGSRQINAIDVTAENLLGSSVLVFAFSSAISGSDLSANGNVISAEASANVATNTMNVPFDAANEATAMVASVQKSADSPTITATANDPSVAVWAEGTLSDSYFAVSTNGVGAVAVANSATNTLTASGNTIDSGSKAAPLVTFGSDNAAGDIVANADFGLLSVQGVNDAAGSAETVISKTDGAALFIVNDVGSVESGSFSVDNNLSLAQATVHAVSNQLTLTGASSIGATAPPSSALVSQQAAPNGTTYSATNSGSTVTLNVNDPGPAVGNGSATLAVVSNRIRSLATGGSAVNRVSVMAGAELAGGVTAPAPTVADLGTTGDIVLNADHSLLNIQSGSLNGTALTSGALAQVTAGEGLNGDTLNVDKNTVEASVYGFDADNRMTLSTKSSSDVTGQVVNVQGGSSTLSASITTASVLGTVVDNKGEGGAVNSDLSVSSNTVQAAASGNSVYNSLTTSADAGLQESSGAGATLTSSATLTGNPVMNATGADYGVLNYQYVQSGSSIGASITTASVAVSDLSGSTGVDSSSVAVSGNTVSASAVANDAENRLGLTSGTIAHPSGVVANLQVTLGGSVSASASGVSVGIGTTGGLIGGTSSNSTLSVQGNSVGASAVGNRAVNTITGD
ncbi:MAG: hypothetical protein GC201_06225 [Alphaproteobacteria bacterium]|nr:hypothetical protein [Alphaproteobacteria bacterium]